jgi:hypothetical protein
MCIRYTCVGTPLVRLSGSIWAPRRDLMLLPLSVCMGSAQNAAIEPKENHVYLDTRGSGHLLRGFFWSMGCHLGTLWVSWTSFWTSLGALGVLLGLGCAVSLGLWCFRVLTAAQFLAGWPPECLLWRRGLFSSLQAQCTLCLQSVSWRGHGAWSSLVLCG